MTIETPGNGPALGGASIRVPEKAQRHLEHMREARARGHWADELDDWSALVASLNREQREALIPLLSKAG